MPEPDRFRGLEKHDGNAGWPTLHKTDDEILSATSSNGGGGILSNSNAVAPATPSEATTPTTLVDWSIGSIADEGDKKSQKSAIGRVEEALPATPSWPHESSTGSHSVSWTDLLTLVGPVSGLAAIVVAIIQLVASYAVLQASHGALVSTWKWQPQVYLAILTAVGNKALAFAVVQGTVITWWLHALQGTTLARMHHDWSYGYVFNSIMMYRLRSLTRSYRLHIWKAMFAGKNFNALALACICATLVLMGEAVPEQN
jgi:hypothetical protein